MQSECCNCDRAAVIYHGPFAYCMVCLVEARRADPDAHRCVKCSAWQPANVSWHRDAPCKSCQMKDSPLKDPRWQRRRLEVMQRDGWACSACGSTTKPLNVHHRRYSGALWDVPVADLVTMCEECHHEHHRASRL